MLLACSPGPPVSGTASSFLVQQIRKKLVLASAASSDVGGNSNLCKTVDCGISAMRGIIGTTMVAVDTVFVQSAIVV